MARDICYGTDFENRIADYFRDLGFSVYQSVYSKYKDMQCQIDLVAIRKGRPLVIECKGYDADKINIHKSSNNWSYIYNGFIHTVPSPLKQADNHRKILYMDMVTSLEESLPSGLLIPNPERIVILKGNVNYSKSNGVFSESSKSLLDMSGYLSLNGVFADYTESHADYSIIIDKINSFLDSKSDISKERLKEHVKYIKDCKKNSTGVFDKRNYK